MDKSFDGGREEELIFLIRVLSRQDATIGLCNSIRVTTSLGMSVFSFVRSFSVLTHPHTVRRRRRRTKQILSDQFNHLQLHCDEEIFDRFVNKEFDPEEKTTCLDRGFTNNFFFSDNDEDDEEEEKKRTAIALHSNSHSTFFARSSFFSFVCSTN